jgi:hypothetical protein
MIKHLLLLLDYIMINYKLHLKNIYKKFIKKKKKQCVYYTN